MSSDNALKIEYDHADYDDLLKHYSRIFKTRYQNEILELPQSYGEGQMKLLILPNGLQCLLGDYKIKQDIIFQRTRNERHFYVLRFDELKEDEDSPSALPRSAACLTSSNFGSHFIYETKGSRIKSLKVRLSEEWLNEFLKGEAGGEQIRKHLSLKSSVFSHEPMDKDYKVLLNQVLYPDCDKRFQLLYLQNRIMLLVERFFANFARRAEARPFALKMPTGDIQRLREAEKQLLKDVTTSPSISDLARMVGMSESKLKASFKEMYGLSVFQYFQRHRMQMAKARLISRKYTIKQISEELGYENVNSFSKAFHKVFDQLPAEVTGE